MTTGAMQFGTTNDAGEDSTILTSGSIESTLAVYNSDQESASAISASGITIGAFCKATSNNSFAVFGTAEPFAANAWGVGVRGESFYGIGVDGYTKDGVAVRGVTNKSGPGQYAVSGAGLGKNNTAVAGVAETGKNACGIWGKSAEGYAGRFEGTVNVIGRLYKTSGGFQIDHPLDPENRYLRHSFVESDQQLNVYSGTVVTDAEGSATVYLPEYFEELNDDFRYQLTIVGREFAHAIVSEEVREARFAIKTDRPEVKVSWQVSGVRKDNYSRHYPFLVEEEKAEEERGRYLHPEAWGQPEEKGMYFDQWAVAREYNARSAPMRPRMPGTE
ncbi:hypothetical protein ACWCPF_44970 [Streptomyces sp. NPDC001858]